MFKFTTTNALLIILIFLALAVIGLLINQNDNISGMIQHEKTPEIGTKAYLFTTQDINGKKIETKNINTLILFFNSDCETCKLNYPLYNE